MDGPDRPGQAGLSVTAWQAFSARQQSMLEIRAQEYAAFRGLSLLKYTLEDG
ncbi:MAG: hypothetical protein ACLS9Y_13565 [Ruthenibacterium lactatiformans]